MAERFVVLFECSPAENPAWVKQVCQSLRLTLVDNDAIVDAMPEEANKLFLEQGVHGEDPRLAPHYAAALEKVARGAHRIALQSSSWLLYGQKPNAVVVDYDPALKDAKDGVGDEQGGAEAVSEYLEEVKRHWRGRLQRHVDELAILELPVGIPEAKKATLASVHVTAAELSKR